MGKKFLYVTTTGGTMGFFKEFIKKLIEEGYAVDIATNETTCKVPDVYEELGCKIFNISCTRSPLNKATFKAIGEIKKIVKENNYDIVHCHTPIAAMCTRFACRKARKKGLKVFYTAHGFHFYKGAPLKNWLIFYPIEKICSYFTDVLITINKEDYALAQKKLRARKIEYVPGVGIDTQKFSGAVVDRHKKREELGIGNDDIMLLSVGELNQNKNHETAIKAIASIGNKNIHYFVAGKGDKMKYLRSLAESLGIPKNIHILGLRTDVIELNKTADIYIHPSFREGLPVSLMEAMASGLPVVCSKIRGNTDLIDQNGGVLFNPYSVEDCKNALQNLFGSDLNELGFYNTEKIKGFSLETVNKRLFEIYNKN